MIIMLAFMCIAQVVIGAGIFLMLGRLSRLETHVIELKTWHIAQDLKARRNANESEELHRRVGSVHPTGRGYRVHVPGNGTVQ